MSDKYMAIATIVSAIISKGEHPLPLPQTRPGTTSAAAFNANAAGGQAPAPFPSLQGFIMRLEEGKICFFDSKENKITLEELINYVSRYLR